MRESTIIIILQVLTVLLGLYLALFKSYFQEKGKNLATKEDIDEITQKVEAVKIEFQVLTHSRTSLNSEKRASYLNFYDKYFLWFNTLLDTSYGNIDYYKDKAIEKYLTKLNNLYIDVCNAEHRMQLWNDNDDLLRLSQKLKLTTLENFHNLCTRLLADFNLINLEAEENQSLPPHVQGSHEVILKKYADKQLEHQRVLISNHKDFISRIHEFIARSRDYLLTIK